MAYNIELTAGKYTAHAISAGAYETPGGALMVGIVFELDNAAHDTITARLCLISKAGVVQEKRISDIRRWAPGWDGVSMEWFADHYGEFNVVLTIERRVDNYDGQEKPEVAFIDPVGSEHNRGAIPNGDAKTLSAKYGAKLRAIAGAVPKPITPANGKNQLEDKKTAAWNAFKAAFAGSDQEINAAWFDLVSRTVPGKTDYNAFSAADWDAVRAAVTKTADVADDMPF